MTEFTATSQTTRLAAEIMRRCDELARFSEPGPGVTRRFATPEHRLAADRVMRWMADAGMKPEMDAVGNVVGRYPGAEPGAPALLLGSHIDTVREGGRYDGMLGVITPIVCVQALADAGERLPFAVEVVAFGDEEGVRYQTTLLGSRALAGTFDMSVLSRQDEDGVSLEQALRELGCEPRAIPGLARRREDLLGYVELHIEQGPVLEAEGLPVGIVTGIAGGVRLNITISGEAGHAGTVPMGRRLDALTGAAEAVLAVERLCQGRDGLVGTVGKLAVKPGATNVIPGEVSFSADIRAPEDAERDRAVFDVNNTIRDIAGRRGLRVNIQETYRAGGCQCAPGLMEQLEAAVAGEGIQPYQLPSGAGHDAMAMQAVTEVAMLFVRCHRGISHNPAEAISGADAGVGARVLLRFLRNFRQS